LSRETVAVLAGGLGLSDREREVLGCTLGELDRTGRRFYFGHLKRREKEFKELLRRHYACLDEAGRLAWLDLTAQAMVARRGEPDLSDRLAMGVLGRLAVYGAVRQKAEEQDVVLKAMISFGGTGMALYLFLFLVLAVILIRYYLR